MKPRFRLGTAFLATTLVAVALGWVADRRRLFDRNDDRFERLLRGKRQILITERDMELAEVLFGERERFEGFLKKQLLLDVWRLWTYEKDVSDFLDSDNWTKPTTKKILGTLQCESAEEYFGMVAASGFNHFPEFRDKDSTEHFEFKRFIIYSLDGID